VQKADAKDKKPMQLTRKQREVLECIGRLGEELGYTPTLENLAEALGLSSVATVHKHVKNLEEKGLLERQWNQSRSMELTKAAKQLLGYETARGPEAVELPLAGRIAAGRPIEAIEDQETLAVPAELVGRHPAFVLRVEGESMIDEHIRDGDYVIAERRQTALDGETVVALIRGEETTLKKLYRDRDRIRLQPANERLEPIFVEPAELQIQGVVIAVIRKY
jgi:repressor LexA